MSIFIRVHLGTTLRPIGLKRKLEKGLAGLL
jgi:hypothetical protein